MSNEDRSQPRRRDAYRRTPAAPGTEDQRELGSDEPRPVWRRPMVTRFGLERTLFFSGSNIDGHGGATPG
jgi:hypothetical protein